MLQNSNICLKFKFTWKFNFLFPSLISSLEKASGLKFYLPTIITTFCLFDMKNFYAFAVNQNF